MNRVKSVNRVFLATVLISILGYFINDWVAGKTNNDIVILIFSQVLLIIPTIAYLTIYKLNVAKAIRFNKIKISNVILIIVFSYLITPLMNFINAISMLFVQNDTTDFMINIMKDNSLWLCFFMVAFVPCILEESVYRGVFYNEYSKVSPWKGILLSGFLFGIIHGNLNQFSYAFAMGVVFALLIEATNSILASMIVHFFINGTSFLAMALSPKIFALLEALYGPDKFNAKELTDAIYAGGGDNLTLAFIVQNLGLTAIIGTILAFIVYMTIAKNSGRWEYVKGIFRRNASMDTSMESTINRMPVVKKQRLLTVSLGIGILICIVLLISNEYYVRQNLDQPSEQLTTMVTHLWNNWSIR